jgi:methylamine dehydrogenase accessory protein MauD
MTALIVANALAWVAIAILVVAVLALARQVGVLHERVAPMGALTMDHGPEVGSAAPVFDLVALDGAPLAVGRGTGRPLLLFFLSPTCPVCKKLLPVLRSLPGGEAGLEVVLASDGEQPEHLAFYRKEKLAPFPYVLSTDLGTTFRISKLPYAVLIGPDGRIAAKGLVNNREQIESLLLAQELGVASLQEYVARKNASSGERMENAVV